MIAQGATRWLLLLAICVAAGFAACSERPDPARFDNPFDPAGAGGDLFELRVSFEGGSVVVRWNPLHESDPGIVSYLLSHATQPTGPFRLVEELVAPENSYVHVNYTRDGSNYYIVQARKVDGVSSESLVVAMGIRTAPTARLSSGLDTTATRMSTFELRPPIVSDEEFELSLDPSFNAFSSFDSAEVAANVVIDLGPAQSDDVFRLYSRVRRGGAVDTTGVDSVVAALRVKMSPQLNTVDMVEDTLLSVELSDLEGVTRMRFARSADTLVLSPWEFPDPDLTPQTRVLRLDVNEEKHEVHGEFESDFGFSKTRMFEVTAQDSIGSVSFSLRTTGGAPGPTAEREVLVLPVAAPGASYMRFSEDLSFLGVSWEPFAASTMFTLTPDPGEKTVFGQFRNPFSNTVADTAKITLTGNP